MDSRQHDSGIPRPLIALLVAVIVGLPMTANAQDDSAEGPSAAEQAAMNFYQAAKAAGRHAEAVKYLLDYMEEYAGENEPLTINLLQRYGNLLREEGESGEAVTALKEARERGMQTFGEYGIEMFEINMDLGTAYVDRELGPGLPKRYFDDALEVLRRHDQDETLQYVTALVNVASLLAKAGVLDGAFAADMSGLNFATPTGVVADDLGNAGLSTIRRSYESGYGALDAYIQEAVGLADKLEQEDPYLAAKISVVRAKIRIIETLFLEVVPPSYSGSISGAAAKQKYAVEDRNLEAAIETLMADSSANRDMIDVANNARLEVAWLREDMQQLHDFCRDGTVNMASRYPRERLFDVADDGTVDAPRYPFRISNNIFTRSIERGLFNRRDPGHINVKKPQFVPVCIDGRLMAALINAPTVTIEEFE